MFDRTRLLGWVLVAFATWALLPGGERLVTGDGKRVPGQRGYPLNIVPPGSPYEIRVVYAIVIGEAGIALLTITKRR